MNNIILKASAGTGKTYRLSLEFIANLIRGVNYKNIVVMTFTKKATAEIKERIFDFLYQIAFDKGNGAELEKNLINTWNISEIEKFSKSFGRLKELFSNDDRDSFLELFDKTLEVNEDDN